MDKQVKLSAAQANDNDSGKTQRLTKLTQENLERLNDKIDSQRPMSSNPSMQAWLSNTNDYMTYWLSYQNGPSASKKPEKDNRSSN